MHNSQDWSVTDSKSLYQIERWSNGFFSISEKGEVTVLIDGENGESAEVSFLDIIKRLREDSSEFQLPTLLRFPCILKNRIDEMFATFREQIEAQDYKGRFRGVYPVKVNQQQQVIQEITEIGKNYHFGLEVGTKPELLAALSYFHDREALLICNGYKDREFVDIALRAQEMGLEVVLVIETAEELPIIQRTAAALGVEPNLGVRVKLFTGSSGLWEQSGGENSPFGLNYPQIINLVDQLREAGQLHWLKMLHYHQGSQVPEIRDIRASVYEAARIYVSLFKEGAPLEILDCGGGLAVDYEGSQSTSPSSKNYTLSEYAADLIEAIGQVTNEANVPNPDIVTESGRAVVAYYSVLVFNILDVSHMDPVLPPAPPEEKPHHMLVNLSALVRDFDKLSPAECYHDAHYYYEQIKPLFYHGVVTLREKAYADEAYWYLTRKALRALADCNATIPEPLDKLSRRLVDIYYGNFSIFQSLPDSWAISQIFPVMPIHRLDEAPTRKAVISDITCDCDGLLDHFSSSQEENQQSHIMLHELFEGENQKHADYFLGIFLVGAYQETLGDLHNLLGDTNVVSISLKNGELQHDVKLVGDTVSEVLSYLEYSSDELLSEFEHSVDLAVTRGRIAADRKQSMLDAYRRILKSYTYFARWDRPPTPPTD